MAVLEDGDGVGQVEDLLEPVGDVEDAHAAFAQTGDDPVEDLDLVVGQRRRRLVHGDDARVVGERLDDLHHLLFGHGQMPDPRSGGDALQAQVVEQFGGGPLHGPVVHQPPGEDLPPQEHVLGDGPLREQVELLEHGGHTGAAGPRGVVEGDLRAVDLDPPAVGSVHPGQHLHQRGLARAVLTDQGVQLPGTQFQVDTVQDPYAQEGLVDAGHSEQGRGVHVGSASSASGTSTQRRSRAESRTASARTAARRPSAKTGSPSGRCPEMAAAVSAISALKQS